MTNCDVHATQNFIMPHQFTKGQFSEIWHQQSQPGIAATLLAQALIIYLAHTCPRAWAREQVLIIILHLTFVRQQRK